jgi:hypothetical protein
MMFTPEYKRQANVLSFDLSKIALKFLQSLDMKTIIEDLLPITMVILNCIANL